MMKSYDRRATSSRLLVGHVALVTGGGRGIGAATSRLLAAAGARVVVNYLNRRDAAEEVVRQIGAAGGEAMASAADVRDATAVEAMLAEVEPRYGAPDILVLNAAPGTFQPRPAQLTEPAELIDRTRDELLAAIVPTRALLPQLLERKAGCIIAITSALCRVPVPAFAPLSVCKGALEAWVRAMAVELGPHGIRVNSVEASMVESENAKVVPEDHKAELVRRVPLGRLAQPEDIAGAVVLLASGLAGFISGVTLPASGGQVLF